MSLQRVAERYSKALLDLANQENKLDEVYHDMNVLHDYLSASDELRSLLNNPVLGVSTKEKVFASIFSSKMGKLTFNFLTLVIKKRREADLPMMYQSFMDLYNKQMGITKVKLTTAIELDQKEIDEIINKIKKAQGFTNVEVETFVDPEIIGGFIAEFNNQILDQSVQTNLNQIKRRLSA